MRLFPTTVAGHSHRIGPLKSSPAQNTIEGMSSDSEALYSQVYQTLNAAGITVNAPAGNDGRGSYASDPDNGMIAVPASYSSTLAVASVSEQDIMGAVTFGDRRIGYRTITRMNQGDAPGFESLEEVLERADLLIIATPHSVFADLKTRIPVVDIWNLQGSGVLV